MTAAGAQATVEVVNVSRWYGNVVAVNDISFGLGPGVTGLLGPNGAGKSTLIHMLCGFLRPSAGAVRVLGEEPWRNPALYRRLGIVQAGEALHGFLSGREFVTMSARLQGVTDPPAAAAHAIAEVELEFALDRALSTYSKGMRQRARIAAALVHDPAVLILDEPFNGADPRQRVQMMDLLRRLAAQGKTILFSSHVLEEVERLADQVLVVVGGRLAASGDFRAIRRLMTDRPHRFDVRVDDPRRLGSALFGRPFIDGVEIENDVLRIRTSDFGTFTRELPRVARDDSIRLLEVIPADESLESVFQYLVTR